MNKGAKVVKVGKVKRAAGDIIFVTVVLVVLIRFVHVFCQNPVFGCGVISICRDA
jgi:hypothetical protein